ncbi:MAG: AMP-binding protein [Myxococcota bacterium]
MNFIETVAGQIAAHPDTPLVTEVHGQTLVPAEGRVLADLIGRARRFLRDRGVKPGDRVVLVAPNSIRWVAVDLAILFEGAVVVPLYARQDPRELGEITLHCKPALLVCVDAELAATLQGLHGDVPSAVFAELFAPEPVHDAPVARSERDPVTVVYTSGTSGVPKGVVLTVANVDYMLPQTRDALAAMMGPRDGADRVFHYLPFCFAGSRIVLWTCLFRGNGIHVSTDLENLVTELGRVDPHYFLNVPMLLERIKNGVDAQIRKRPVPVQWLYSRGHRAFVSMDGASRPRKRDRLVVALAKRVIYDKVRERIGPSLECLICGSAPLGEDTQRWFAMLGIPVYQVYGLTETTAIVTMDVPPRVVPGRVGPALEGVELRLMDGELQVRGPNVFAEYLFAPDETEKAFQDGWFRTGDQAEVDATGNWRIVGRVKNLLVPSSGHNVAPEPIEQKLVETLEGVDAAVLVGHGRPWLAAILSGNVDAHGLADAIQAVNEELPHYRRVRKWIVADEPFTPENGLLTANRKLKRAAIEAAYADRIDRLYA